MRPNNRLANQLRPITIQRHYTKYAEGSVLISFGDTKVLCNASVVESVPRFLKGTGQGWITAEYSMLPRATHDRCDREATHGRQQGRTIEISRLIGRSLRAAVDLKALGECTITVDCDVIQADGGTRTAAITGGCIALADAISVVGKKHNVKTNPFKGFIASVSVGVHEGKAILDLEYVEDSNAETDMNVIMNEQDQFIEIQGTAEKGSFSQDQLSGMLELARSGICDLITKQKESLKNF